MPIRIVLRFCERGCGLLVKLLKGSRNPEQMSNPCPSLTTCHSEHRSLSLPPLWLATSWMKQPRASKALIAVSVLDESLHLHLGPTYEIHAELVSSVDSPHLQASFGLTLHRLYAA